ncbi:MAG TPA: UDP-N-acetylmuramoyl-L-alanine--D-glutamate ligase, partial [Deltaproteobacteria bacterium]|nr:UDP-N-acetylmuramoyl-L-alanine--D-glutamate ligase [Deltaproteobacteria bacterium]
MKELRGAHVLVLGLGISGQSAAQFCAAQGAARVVAADERSREALGDLAALPRTVEVSAGGPLPDPAQFDLVVPSPGVPPARYAARARRVWGDVELAYRALAVPIVAITGTNGKSTTTRLVEAMARAAGLRAEAAGNIGAPALGLVGRPLDVAVLEVSSFQLETTESFRPRVAAILNVTPDHLDRHGSFEAYAAAKARILEHQGPEDTAVLSADDPVVAAMGEKARGRVRRFSLHRGANCEATLDAGAALLRGGDASARIPLDGLRLRGAHNLENVLAALLCVAALGADPLRAARALASFDGLPHRMELVRWRGEVAFVNDSKGTNVGAALRSLESFVQPVVWIGGGKDKGLDFTQLARLAERRVRASVLIGEAAGKLAAALDGHTPVYIEPSIEAAVRRASELAQPGDVVLLSPACASFDQFRSYEDR